MGQGKGIDEAVINKDTSVIYGEDIRLTQIKQIKNQQDVFDKELDRISEDLTFTMVALLIVSALLLVTIVFLILVINRVGL
ncbi:MAG TPA: hypothetical protein IAA20_02390 [Candidatus Enterococcus avicola]|uniref:Uncharacterized protein n=1 Tax=Candidatus Enterococcus avicola TaxID=2838561 RepID=A0A9D2F5F6_9ENTE|nr:hypothetical protein [Weissella thailandensis]HIZ52775.1 hypothetical protein [Candidatus Enterococcus avicola]HJA22848.1 hypothetical protein [Candidatus Limosilactobacillus intestinavium]